MKNNNLFLVIVVAIVVGASSFFAGIQYQKMSVPQGQFAGLRQGNNDQRYGQGGQGFGQGGFRPVTGQIISQNDKSITVKLQDGSSKIVFLSDKTTINKAAEGTKEDLKEGVSVVIFGQENSDGNITAQSIQLNPTFRGGMDQLPNQ